MSDSSGELFFWPESLHRGKPNLRLLGLKKMMRKFCPVIPLLFTRVWTLVRPSPVWSIKMVCHYGLDLSPVNECFDISRFVEYARDVVSQVHASGKKLLVVGGSGFYLHSFFEPVIDDVSVKPEIRMEVEALRLQGIDQMMDRLRLLNPDGLGNLDLFNPMRVAKALERCMSSGKSLLELNHEFASLPKPYAELRKSVLWLDRERRTSWKIVLCVVLFK